MYARPRHPRRLVGTAAAVLLVTAALVAPATASATAHAWKVSAQFPPPIAYLGDVACFSATGCVAVGWTTTANGFDPSPIELRTIDAGAQWAPVVVPDDTRTLVAIACAATLCVAGGQGGVVLRSTDDGLTWKGVALPASVAAVTSIACPSTTACFAEGASSGLGPSGVIAGTTDGGATWASLYSETTTPLHSLWCQDATTCFAYGSQYLATTDGALWGIDEVGPDFPTLAVCPTATTCVGSSPSAGIVTSGDGGSTWTMADGDVVPTQLACGSATSCVGTDGTNLVTTSDGGATWSEQSPGLDDEVLDGAACPAAGDCQVVGFDTADGYPDRALVLGVSPSTQSFAPERVSNELDVALDASCVSASVCAVAAVDPYANPVLLRTVDGGTTWSDVVLPASFAQLDAVRCITASTCFVTGGSLDGEGAIWKTTDAGATWIAAGVPASVGEVDGLACTTALRCEAVGYLVNSWTAVLSSSNGGRSWTSTPMPHTATSLFGVDCPTVSDCVVVGGRNGAVGVAYASVTGGRTWRASRVLGGMRALNDVSCSSALDCVAGSEVRHGATPHGTLARTTDGGATWEPVAAPGATSNLFSVDCWSRSWCEAVGQTTGSVNPLNPNGAAAIVSSNGGRTWTTQPLPADQWALFAVSCASSGACVAVGAGSFAPPKLPTGATVLRLA